MLLRGGTGPKLKPFVVIVPHDPCRWHFGTQSCSPSALPSPSIRASPTRHGTRPILLSSMGAHLASEPGPHLEHCVGIDVDGVEFKVRLDYGCAFTDNRGWFKNPGA